VEAGGGSARRPDGDGAIGTAHAGSSRMQRGPEDLRWRPREPLQDTHVGACYFPSDGWLERRTAARSDGSIFGVMWLKFSEEVAPAIIYSNTIKIVTHPCDDNLDICLINNPDCHTLE
jgi:hypothetical protein